MIAALGMLLTLLLRPAPQNPSPRTDSTETIKRSVVGETGTMQAVRVTYLRGAVEPPGPHGYDAVLVPIDPGLSVELEGQRVEWTPGVPILLPRGAPHRVRNAASDAVTFISVRVLNQADPYPADEAREGGSAGRVTTSGVTLVRHAMEKYVRVATFRFERGGVMRAETGDRTDAMIVLAAPAPLVRQIGGSIAEGRVEAGTVLVVQAGVPFSLRNPGEQPFEVVRISVAAAARPPR